MNKIKQGGSGGSGGYVSWQVRQAWVRAMGELRRDEKRSWGRRKRCCKGRSRDV